MPRIVKYLQEIKQKDDREIFYEEHVQEIKQENNAKLEYVEETEQKETVKEDEKLKQENLVQEIKQEEVEIEYDCHETYDDFEDENYKKDQQNENETYSDTTSEKQNACSICSKNFTRSVGLRTHMRYLYNS